MREGAMIGRPPERAASPTWRERTGMTVPGLADQSPLVLHLSILAMATTSAIVAVLG